MKKTAAFFVLLAGLFVYGASAEAANTIKRYDGSNRINVAVSLSRDWNTSGTVILASYSAYADSLAAAPLAYRLNAPILLTNPGGIPAETRTRISQLKASKVILIGGTSSISGNVYNQLKGMGISSVERINGRDRYEVAANIAKKFPSSSKAIFASGTAYADALSIAPYAARSGTPILLVSKNSVPYSTKSAISSRGINNAVLVGGTASVSDSVYHSLAPTRKRISGEDRYKVAANVAAAYKMSSDKVFIANGHAYADALAGSVAAAKQNASILLTKASAVPGSTMSHIKVHKMSGFSILGGTKSVSSSVTSRLSSPLLGRKIMIDPGHGYKDPGAVNKNTGQKEKNIVLDIGKRTVSKLSAKDAYPVMTRTGDTYPTLDERVEMAVKQNADVFVSIHNNANISSSPDGTETYWSTKSPESKLLAEEIQKQLASDLEMDNRGVKTADFKVIKHGYMPSVLVEVGFLSNSREAALLNQSAFRDRAANAIYEGIYYYFQKYE
ncbi:N-acetylmuramoyl-L-alanine amidase [Bacillus mangrovi]|uniref:N-acetylmuramoyl-L-alanine amidase n=1 Tax=Metabacillus mangrovi TaxID=1491830 RepID=A0A7X2V621_9BACI|nr:cell wall-binding repeat-containing protein [Metabacillus mangrovi]MTH55035.1 N-acetylmuramoyl-L-alanine amidase [Metabacillus mangrovi]